MSRKAFAVYLAIGVLSLTAVAPIGADERIGALPEIVFAERHPGRDPQRHYYANFGYACTNENEWLHGADGARLCRYDPNSGKLRVLLHDPQGSIRDPQVSYDAQRILFSYRKGGMHHYNLYEINADGTGMQMLSSGAVTENTPSILPDGRILYTRWEYVNRDAVSFHHLWTMNPDGTDQQVFYGNQTPGQVFIDAQPIPQTRDVVFIDSGYHGSQEHAGKVMIVSESDGPNSTEQLNPDFPGKSVQKLKNLIV